MTRGNDLNGKHDEWKFMVEYCLSRNYIIMNFWIRVIRVAIFWVVIILGGSFPGGNCPSGSYPGWEFIRWELSGWELSWVGIFLGGNFTCGNCPVGIVRVICFRVVVLLVPVFGAVLGSLSLRGRCSWYFSFDELTAFV